MATDAPIRILVYLLGHDLRFIDNPILSQISRSFREQAATITHLLPIYVFPADYVEVSGFIPDALGLNTPAKSPYPEARSRVGKFWRTGPHRVKFLAESVWDLKNTLEQKGSGLTIRAGSYADVLRHVFRHMDDAANENLATSASIKEQVVGVWMARSDGHEEIQVQDELRKLVEGSGREFRLFEDKKYFIEEQDLPFKTIKDLPDVFTEFRKSLEPLRKSARLPEVDAAELPPLPPADCIAPQFAPFSIPKTLPELIESLLKPVENNLDLSHPPRWPSPSTPGRPQTQSAHPFRGGESEGLRRLEHLLCSGAMTAYQETRNGLLGPDFSTKLSAYLAIGCITARQIHAEMLLFEDGEIKDDAWDGAREEKEAKLLRWKSAKGFGKGESTGTGGVRFELLWRDYFRLVQRKIGTKLYQLHGTRCEKEIKWKKLRDDNDPDVQEKLQRFRSGRTGLGLVDAAQRELCLTGYQSNRARQNVASFLAKHLGIDWRLGAEWFECMLVDYDSASNWGNWQYVAGVGNDPREGRKFNPVKQALDYDSRGDYIKAWVEELQDLDLGGINEDGRHDPEKLMGLFQPWRLPASTKEKLGLTGHNHVNNPLIKIEFSVGRKPRISGRSRSGRARNRGSTRPPVASPDLSFNRVHASEMGGANIAFQQPYQSAGHGFTGSGRGSSSSRSGTGRGAHMNSSVNSQGRPPRGGAPWRGGDGGDPTT